MTDTDPDPAAQPQAADPALGGAASGVASGAVAGSAGSSVPVPPAARMARRGWWRRGGRVFLWLLAVPPVFAVIALGLMFDRDITAPGWVTQEVEARAAQMLGGGSLRFGQIALRVGRDLHPRVMLRDTVLRDAAGQPLARIAGVEATISPRALILDRAALVQHVALTGSAVAVTRTSDGVLQLSFDLPGIGQGAVLADGLAGLVRQIDGLRDRPALSALEDLTLDGLDLTYTDDRAGRVWTVDDGRFRFDIGRNTTSARADLAVQGPQGTATLGLALDSDRASDAATLQITVADAQARDLASQSAALGFLGALDAPLSATLTTALDDAGQLGPLTAQLAIGAGVLQPAPQTAPLAFDGVAATLVYDPASTRLAFSDVSIASDWGAVSARGQALARSFENGLPTTLVGQFALTDIALTPADLYADPVTVAQADVDLRLRLDPFRLDIGQVTITDPALTLTASGALTATADGWDARVDLTSPEVSRDTVLRLWPARVRPGTRLWFNDNLTQANLSGVTAGWRKAPGLPSRVAIGFAYDAATVRFLRDQPPITGGAGYATLADDAFVLRLDAGRVTAPQGGSLDVAGTVLQIPDVTVRAAPLVVDLATAGSITATLAMLDLPPFGYVSRANLPVTVADGRAAVQAQISLPLKRPLGPGDVTFAATGQLTRVRSERLVPNRTLAASDLAVTLDRAGLRITGAASLDGVPLSGSFTQGFGPGAAAPTVTGRVTISADALSAFGVALPPGTVGGTGPGDLTVTLPRGAPPQFALTTDLAGLSLSVPAIGYALSRGGTGRLAVSGRLGARPAVDRLSLRAPGLVAEGAVSLTAAGQLDTALFSRVAVGDWFDGAVSLRGRGRGQPVGVTVTGGTLNLPRATFGGGGGGTGGGGQGAPITVALDRLTIAEGLSLTGFRGDFDTTGGLAGQFNGSFNGQAPVRGAVAPSGGRTAARITADDAGAVLRAGRFLDGARDGTLDLTLIPSAQPGSFDGTLALRGLRVRDAPTIAALLDAVSVVGLLQQLDGQGLAFDTVDATFRLTPDQIILTQSSAVGPGLGISLDGIYTLGTRGFDFQGVLSPFYILNGIGSFLTRRGEGLIGFNFTVRGTAAAPQVGVNPLSGLTPGMFREIFRRPPPQVGN